MFAALLLCVAGNVHADWRRDYEFGQQALEKGDWAEAEKLMRSAQAEEPAASLRKRFQGTRFQLYAPAHFAAIAAFKQGSCSRAMDYFNDPGTRAVTAQATALAAEQKDVERACGSQVAAAPTTELPRTTVAPPPVVKPATTVVDTRTTTAGTRQLPPEPRVTAAVPANPPPTPVAPPPATSRTVAPSALRAGISAFLAGDYEAALRINAAAVEDTHGRALLLLVRAAAGFTRAELKGGDAAMVARAELDVKASRRLTRIEPDPVLFSPKLRQRIANSR